MRSASRFLCVLALAVAFAGGASARDEASGCRAFVTPDGAKLLYVASDMLVNGVPMSIKEMRTRDARRQTVRAGHDRR